MQRKLAAGLLLLAAVVFVGLQTAVAASLNACSRPDVAGRCKTCSARRGCTACRPGSVLTGGGAKWYATCSPCPALLGCGAGACSTTGCRNCERFHRVPRLARWLAAWLTAWLLAA